MKFFIGITFLIGFVAVSSADECQISRFCEQGDKNALLACNSRLESFKDVELQLKDHLNKELTASFDYLMLSSYYNTYIKNRPGFQKLFQGLSDTAWDNTINLIKHITKRGGAIKTIEINRGNGEASSYNEVEAMAWALNKEKELIKSVQEHHRHDKRDPQTRHYLEENFLEPKVDVIRKLAGYTTDLTKFVESAPNSDASLAFFLFDEYLQKQ